MTPSDPRPEARRPVRVESAEGAFMGVTLDVAERLGVDVAAADSMDGRNRIGSVVIPSHPPQWIVEAALLRTLRPRHILFLCVANSARSQVAEGLARSMAWVGTEVSSAGSEPGSVRPQAVETLREIGIDIEHHHSKAIQDIRRPVDTVITLCAEEVCPVWLGDAPRLHWPLPDPAAVEGDEAAKLAAFRNVRDELRRRFAVLFG